MHTSRCHHDILIKQLNNKIITRIFVSSFSDNKSYYMLMTQIISASLKKSLETFEEENEERNHESANLTRSRRDDKQTIAILLIFISLSFTNWSKWKKKTKEKNLEFPISSVLVFPNFD